MFTVLWVFKEWFSNKVALHQSFKAATDILIDFVTIIAHDVTSDNSYFVYETRKKKKQRNKVEPLRNWETRPGKKKKIDGYRIGDRDFAHAGLIRSSDSSLSKRGS